MGRGTANSRKSFFTTGSYPDAERDSVERYLADKWGITLYSDALPSAEPENGLLAYYKFEPVSIEPDKLWDYSGNNHHGMPSQFR